MNNSGDASGRVEWRKKRFTVMVSPTCIFSQNYFVEAAFCQRAGKAESRRGRFSLSVGSLSAWGEDEADKWEWVGVETEQETGRTDLSVILEQTFERCPPDCLLLARHLSDNTHLFFLLWSDVCFMSVKAPLSLGHTFLSNTHLFTFSDLHKDKWPYSSAERAELCLFSAPCIS